jgi:hypothetical protein
MILLKGFIVEWSLGNYRHSEQREESWDGRLSTDHTVILSETLVKSKDLAFSLATLFYKSVGTYSSQMFRLRYFVRPLSRAGNMTARRAVCVTTYPLLGFKDSSQAQNDTLGVLHTHYLRSKILRQGYFVRPLKRAGRMTARRAVCISVYPCSHSKILH